MPAVEGSATWFPAFAAPAGDTRQLYGNALSLAIGVLLDDAAVRQRLRRLPVISTANRPALSQ
jgi:hypothetical protein